MQEHKPKMKAIAARIFFPTPTFIPLRLQTIQHSNFTLLLFNINLTNKIQYPQIFSENVCQDFR
jgi:hypothetical protein